MILGVGVDIVSVGRMERWKQYSYDQLRKVFSKSELDECKLAECYNWSSLAARFAAKEALYKALSSMLVKLSITAKEFSFLFWCENVSIERGTWDLPVCCVRWEEIENKISAKLPNVSIDLSLSHETDYAIAFVVISET